MKNQFFAKSQRKNYSTENKVIGENAAFDSLEFYWAPHASRKWAIRTPILGGGYPLSLRPILGNPLGLPAFLLMQQPKIRSLKILRPEKDSILSRFWCGRCSKARRGAKMTSQKMPKFHLFRRVRITLFRLAIAPLGSRLGQRWTTATGSHRRGGAEMKFFADFAPFLELTKSLLPILWKNRKQAAKYGSFIILHFEVRYHPFTARRP